MPDSPEEIAAQKDPSAPPAANDSKETFYAAPVWKRFYAFMLGPALVAGAIVGVIVMYGVLLPDDVDPARLVEQLRSGGDHARSQAAFKLTTYLQPSVTGDGEELQRESDASYEEKLAQVRVLVPELLEIYDDPKRGDLSTRRFLAMALSYLGDVRAVPALANTLEDGDVELVHYALAALGRISEAARERAEADHTPFAPQTVESVIVASRRSEHDVRATACYILGVLGTVPAMARLEEAVDDPAPSVRWNAAFGLARAGSNGGERVILEVLDRGPIYRAAGPDPQRMRDLFLNAVRSAGMLRTPQLEERLTRIAESDEDLKARDVAIKVLKGKRPS